MWWIVSPRMWSYHVVIFRVRVNNDDGFFGREHLIRTVLRRGACSVWVLQTVVHSHRLHISCVVPVPLRNVSPSLVDVPRPPPPPPLPIIKVILTDADAAMTSAVAQFLPNTIHLHWHIMKNARKNCQAALSTKAKRFFRLLKAAAFATS